MKNMKNIISLLLVFAICGSLSVSVFAVEPVDSVGSAKEDIFNDTMVGNDSTQGEKSTYTEVSYADNQNVEVYVTKASTYSITIPKTIILDGSTNVATGEYSVKVSGDISGMEIIYVIPNSTFNLKQTGKNDICASITQSKTSWQYANLSVDAIGLISAENLSAGSWSGSFTFNISRVASASSMTVLLNNNTSSINKFSLNKLSVKSDAPLDSFVNLIVNDQVVDPQNYVLSEGSTIVTFTDEYLAQLKNGEYVVQIVSNDKTATGTLNIENKLPLGAKYYTDVPEDGDYTKGTLITDIIAPQTGDVFIYGDYEYRYNMYQETDGTWYPFEDWWYYETIPEGWGMDYIGENNSSPTNPVGLINGKAVTCAISAFFLHTEVEYAPLLPNSIVNMSYAFCRCENLKYVPNMPSNITEMAHCFVDCYKLTESPNLLNCNNLTNIEGAYWCSGLKILPELPNSVVEASSVFEECNSLIDVSYFVIPENIVDTYAMFAYCVNLQTAPVIPEHVTSLWRTFRGCTSLQGVIEINGNITEYRQCFEKVDMSKITLTGTCEAAIKQNIANTGKNGNQVIIP